MTDTNKRLKSTRNPGINFIGNLPPEVGSAIFTFLEIHEIAKIRLVCKKWDNMCSSNNVWAVVFNISSFCKNAVKNFAKTKIETSALKLFDRNALPSHPDNQYWFKMYRIVDEAVHTIEDDEDGRITKRLVDLFERFVLTKSSKNTNVMALPEMMNINIEAKSHFPYISLYNAVRYARTKKDFQSLLKTIQLAQKRRCEVTPHGISSEPVWFHGVVVDGRPSGYGRFTENTVGNFFGVMDGDQFRHGQLDYISGDEIYIGSFKNNVEHGEGSFYVRTNDHQNNDYFEIEYGLYYKGSFVNGVKSGTGTTYIPEGVTRCVSTEDDDEKSYYFEINPEVYVGEFVDGEKHGHGIEYDPEGRKVFDGKYIEGMKIKGKTYLYLDTKKEPITVIAVGSLSNNEEFDGKYKVDVFRTFEKVLIGSFTGEFWNGVVLSNTAKPWSVFDSNGKLVYRYHSQLTVGEIASMIYEIGLEVITVND